MESSSVRILRRRNENHSEDTRSDSDTLSENRVTTEVRLVHAWTDTRGICFGRKKKIEVREGNLNGEYERPDNPRRSGSSVCEAEKRSLFHSIQKRTNISVSIEHLSQDAKRRR